MNQPVKAILTLIAALVVAFGIAAAVPSGSITEEAADRYQDAAFAEEE